MFVISLCVVGAVDCLCVCILCCLLPATLCAINAGLLCERIFFSKIIKPSRVTCKIDNYELITAGTKDDEVSDGQGTNSPVVTVVVVQERRCVSEQKISLRKFTLNNYKCAIFFIK